MAWHDERERFVMLCDREIVRAFRALPDPAERIAAMYAETPVLRSADILNGEDHSLYFRV